MVGRRGCYTGLPLLRKRDGEGDEPITALAFSVAECTSSRSISQMPFDETEHELLLHISRMTNDRSDVLSVSSLVRHAPIGLRPEINERIDAVKVAVAFARDVRNRHIAHRNIDVALQRAVRPNARKPRRRSRCAEGHRRSAALR